ncbi:alpha/beta hydrolase [Streptomyces lycii]|uniref:Acyl-CoA:diacylglycerol acyltransferase n=2 Tax=Streptomyces TaxID=1883 RepID=A0ABQ7FES9_9ACTN|nr:alpha/beta hydrolase-fold protein [Streptomyces lycii]KAF4407102.1 hypothetical protein GCU69_21525 [Streptomyces lycii]
MARSSFSRRRLVGGVAAASAAGLASPLLGAGTARARPATASPAASGGAGGVRVLGERRTGGRLLDLTLRSPALGADAEVRLITPSGWDERAEDDRWPVLWLLPGGDGDHKSFTREYRFQELPELRHILVVMPSMPFYGFYTDWWNGGRGGTPAVESFHLREVLPLLEHRYGAGRRRAVAGESQGGYGALTYTARHPGTFRAAAGVSGFLHPLMYVKAVSGGAEFLGVDWRRIWGDPVRQRHVWAAHDPFHLADRLRGVPVHIACGDGTPGALDPPGTEPDPVIPGLQDLAGLFPEEVISLTEAVLGDESRAVAHRFRQRGVPITTHFYRGTHSPAYWERELRAALPALLDALHR